MYVMIVDLMFGWLLLKHYNQFCTYRNGDISYVETEWVYFMHKPGYAQSHAYVFELEVNHFDRCMGGWSL